MLSFTDFKYWSRSRSLQFMRDRPRPATVPASELASFRWNGHPVYYRPGSSDMTVIYRILLKPERKREYRLPENVNPRVILDIGANIGVTALLFARRFPHARIVCFEPVPRNFEILQKNTAPYANVESYAVALGAKDGEENLFFSDDDGNHGGFSFFEKGSRTDRALPVALREINGFLREKALDAVDVIKIDTEGSEHAILTQLDPERLKRVKWITGELHGNRDFELLHYLTPWFEIAITKPLQSRLSVFEARNKEA